MQIKWMEGKNDSVYLNTSLEKRFTVIPNRLNINLGCIKIPVRVIFTNQISKEVIGLSENIKEIVSIPTLLAYEIRLEERNIYIGPIIAICVNKKKKSLTQKVLKRTTSRFRNCSESTGLIYICTVEGINTEKKQIEGYYYDPNAVTRKKKFKKGIFPFPNSLYVRTKIPEKIYHDLLNSMGEKIFNSYFFDKVELWEYVKSEQDLVTHFPDTTTVHDINEVITMLIKHSSIYLKPARGSLGHGIIKIILKNGEYIIKKHSGEIFIFKSKAELEEWLKKTLNTKYIVQKGVNLEFNKQIVDFRIYMQKNKSMNWKSTGYIARFSKEGEVTTNTQNLDVIKNGKETLKKVFNIKEDRVDDIEKYMKSTCTAICEYLDKSVGNFGDVAIDFIIDSDFKIWILEINKRYFTKTLKQLQDKSLFYEVRSKPLEYARALSGF
ncbi:YheC/YheD family protein [Mesobacillus harenae]|uniref:YheC/YheD family endospore coat-associated protein n=1 Tax=Mesobacillus harenae TaxID=2213203 RepID=UPI0015804FDF|nr:YheC/YheD family protein [Mesobacillus harenae]